MPRIRASALRLSAFAFLALGLAACDAVGPGDGNNPPGPPGPPEPPGPSITALRIDFARIEVIRDCDGIEGDGEFDFRVTASTGTGLSHTAFSGGRDLGDGGSVTALSDRRFEFPASNGQQVDVTFRATEWDADIFGATFADSRMDGLTATRTHRFNAGAWSPEGAITLTNGSGDCEVRLYYAVLPE